MTHKFTHLFVRLLCCLSACLILGGCGKDEEAEKERNRSALNKVAGLKKRFHQLDATLTQMDVEADIQKQKIGAAKSELNAIRDMLASGRYRDLAGDYSTTAPITPVRGITSDDQENTEADAARDGVFRTLVILLFLLFAGVFLAKLWRDRHNVPVMPEDRSFEPSNYEGTEDKQPSPPAN